jgi:hypothetical protein
LHDPGSHSDKKNDMCCDLHFPPNLHTCNSSNNSNDDNINCNIHNDTQTKYTGSYEAGVDETWRQSDIISIIIRTLFCLDGTRSDEKGAQIIIIKLFSLKP